MDGRGGADRVVIRKAIDHDAGFRPPASATSPGWRHRHRHRRRDCRAGCGAQQLVAKVGGASASVRGRGAADWLHRNRRGRGYRRDVDGYGGSTSREGRDRGQRDDRAENAPAHSPALSAVLPGVRHVQQVRGHGRRRVRMRCRRDLQQGRGHGQVRPSTAVDGALIPAGVIQASRPVPERAG